MGRIETIKAAIRAELERQGESKAFTVHGSGARDMSVGGMLDLDALAAALWNTALFGEGKPITDSEGRVVGWAKPSEHEARIIGSDETVTLRGPDVVRQLDEAGEEFAPSEPVATNDLRFVGRWRDGRHETILQQRWTGAAGEEWLDIPLVSP